MSELNEPMGVAGDYAGLADRYRERLAAVDALHGAVVVVAEPPESRFEHRRPPLQALTICGECRQPWPCRTARALR